MISAERTYDASLNCFYDMTESYIINAAKVYKTYVEINFPAMFMKDAAKIEKTFTDLGYTVSIKNEILVLDW